MCIPGYLRSSHPSPWIGTEVCFHLRRVTGSSPLLVGTIVRQTQPSANAWSNDPLVITIPTQDPKLPCPSVSPAPPREPFTHSETEHEAASRMTLPGSWPPAVAAEVGEPRAVEKPNLVRKRTQDEIDGSGEPRPTSYNQSLQSPWQPTFESMANLGFYTASTGDPLKRNALGDNAIRPALLVRGGRESARRIVDHISRDEYLISTIPPEDHKPYNTTSRHSDSDSHLNALQRSLQPSPRSQAEPPVGVVLRQRSGPQSRLRKRERSVNLMAVQERLMSGGRSATSKLVPPRVDSTQPRDTSPEMSGDDEEIAGKEDRARVEGDTDQWGVNGVNWVGKGVVVEDQMGEVQEITGDYDDDEDWIDEDEEGNGNDLLYLLYHPSYVRDENKRRRWENKWEALAEAVRFIPCI